LSQAGESVVVERVAEEPGFEVANRLETYPEESREGLERTIGIALAVLGLALMALAAL
jgi:hypothetical protein